MVYRNRRKYNGMKILKTRHKNCVNYVDDDEDDNASVPGFLVLYSAPERFFSPLWVLRFPPLLKNQCLISMLSPGGAPGLEDLTSE